MILQEFSFGNFKSFKDIQTLNFLASSLTSKSPQVDSRNTFQPEGIPYRFLKSKAIYGANASGKSNVVKALGVFFLITIKSVGNETILENLDSFKLSTDTESEPIFFQLVFWVDGVRYRYGFEADRKKIHSEWLYGKPSKRELPYFIREGQKILEYDKTNFNELHLLENILEEAENEGEAFRTNSLLLGTLAAFGFKKSKLIVSNMEGTSILSGLHDKRMREVSQEVLDDKEARKDILNFLRIGDIGIHGIGKAEPVSSEESEITSNEKQDGKIIVSVHLQYDDNLKSTKQIGFDFYGRESAGTQKLLDLSPFIFISLEAQRTLIIDEFDARLHPLLTQKILELFNSEENKGAQLVFVTHDTNLLSPDLLRRDQIEFVEKDKYGASHLYSLASIKGVRNDAAYEKDYIRGKYGAIPFLKNFEKLIYDNETIAENAETE
ncbi:MAG: ATP-binding protein [Bacteroidota bacterium]